MIGEISQAVIEELKELLIEKGGTVVLMNLYKPTKTYLLPLTIVEIKHAPDSAQMVGGMSRMDWDIIIRFYNASPDAYGDDLTGYNAELLNECDSIRQHFEKENWLTQYMTDAKETYGIRFTFNGISDAEPLEQAGIQMGYSLTFNTVSFDEDTSKVYVMDVASNVIDVVDETNI